jgi:hypothetical protein
LAQGSVAEQIHPVSDGGNGKKSSWFSPESPSHKGWVTIALMLGILTQGLNFGALNVALPSMMTILRADVENITKAMLLVRKVMPDEAAVMAYRDCYMAIALSSLVSLVLTLFLRLPPRRR